MPRAFRTAVLASVLAPVLAGSAAATPPPAKSVDLARYVGRWFEVARLHNRIEEDCVSAEVDYIKAAGRLSAVDSCRRSPPARDKVYRASVRVLDPGVNAKLRLTFFPLVFKDYWVLDRADDYSWALIGEGTGRYLWLFSRQAAAPAAERETMAARARALGYDTSKLIYDRP